MAAPQNTIFCPAATSAEAKESVIAYNMLFKEPYDVVLDHCQSLRETLVLMGTYGTDQKNSLAKWRTSGDVAKDIVAIHEKSYKELQGRFPGSSHTNEVYALLEKAKKDGKESESMLADYTKSCVQIESVTSAIAKRVGANDLIPFEELRGTVNSMISVVETGIQDIYVLNAQLAARFGVDSEKLNAYKRPTLKAPDEGSPKKKPRAAVPVTLPTESKKKKNGKAKD